MTTKSKTDLLEGLLIDPFRREIRRVRVARGLDTWTQLLGCDRVDYACLASDGASNLDLWFDDEFTFREPAWPAFRLTSSVSTGSQQYVINGYGLALASDADGQSVSLTSTGHSVDWFASATGIQFEIWQKRLDPDDYLKQLLRTPEIELAGRFEYIKP